MKILIIVLFLVGLCLVLLGITMLIKKGGKFPDTHIGRNQEMKKRGINCANTTDALERKEYNPVKIDD
ncbi:hypothetical protein LJB85_03770 [Porphyromonadaceae bacterium OttesenSCG-928-L07]|nr:hypothetical protein [Porphyromonadaceae bacterium OttesenSCG-928-L07]MDL2252224.1 hypothetical protein [Odoribacter sp. OttesenSCG-928-J03]MDL2283508.1 hypothetical protein [Odoribacter sp. OttesenSCG-928-G04]